MHEPSRENYLKDVSFQTMLNAPAYVCLVLIICQSGDTSADSPETILPYSQPVYVMLQHVKLVIGAVFRMSVTVFLTHHGDCHSAGIMLEHYYVLIHYI